MNVDIIKKYKVKSILSVILQGIPQLCMMS